MFAVVRDRLSEGEMFDFIILVWDLLFAMFWESFEILCVAVFGANGLSMWLPNQSRNKYIQAFLNLLNALSMNIHKNANQRYPINKKKKKEKPWRAEPMRRQGDV